MWRADTMKISVVIKILLIYGLQDSLAWTMCGDLGGCDTCDNGASCVPVLFGSYQCQCPAHFIGSGCNIPLLKSGWFDGGNGFQYQMQTIEMTYEKAKDNCEIYGAKLATHGPRNIKWIRENNSTFLQVTEYWIGLAAVGGMLFWTDGIPVNEIFSLPHSQPNMTNEKCIAFARNSTSFFYRNLNCTSKRISLCEAPIGYPPRIPVFKAENGYSYSIITPANYQTSQKLCAKQGGKLAEKVLENKLFVKKILQYFSDNEYIKDLNLFVGYTDENMEGNYITDNGTMLNTDLVWEPKNPDADAANEDCLTISPNYWAWLNDKRCDLILPGLCEISKTVKYLTESECRNGKSCPENAACFVSEGSAYEECYCLDGYIKTADGNCTKDLCKRGLIRCGPNAICAVINEITNEQGCVCKDGFRSHADVKEQGCFEDTINGNLQEITPPPPLVTCPVRDFNCPAVETYRNIEGFCNNKQNPTWGVAFTPLKRLLPAAYDNGTDVPRQTSTCGLPLPSTRLVSNTMVETEKRESDLISHLHVLWGQLLAHDMVHTPMETQPDGKGLNCSCAQPDPNCFNIQLPSDDEQTLATGKTCMSISRSRSAAGINCTFSQRQQLTSMSAFIDATALYGKNDQELSELRNSTSDSGLLITREPHSGGILKLLPTQDQLPNTMVANKTDCDLLVHRPLDEPCFVAGDVRSNENSGLISMQTVLIRYHQILARRLKAINPSWDSDKILQTVKSIITAILQRITYTDYLIPLVGPVMMKRYDLTLLEEGHWDGYDPSHNPTISNSFTAAVFRYGHSQLATSLGRPGTYFEKNENFTIRLKDSYFNSEPFLNATNGGGVGSLIRGLMIGRAESVDTTLVDDVRNQLFTKFNEQYGLDLMAINLQRGRDHGLPPYNEFRVLCGLKRALTFSCLSQEVPYNKILKLRSVYKSVDDIDLYIGGLSETPLEYASVGPTFACLQSHQFRALRRGDRFWHENPHTPTPMTLPQLDAVRSLTLSRILCETGEDMEYVSLKPLSISKASAIVPCSSLKELRLEPWSDNFPNASSFQSKATKWSVWFTTNQQYGIPIDTEVVLNRTRDRNVEEVCPNVLSHEIRQVPHDKNAQVRFLCPAGSIKASDVPHQISHENYFTQWRITQPISCGKGYSISMDVFGCDQPIAIQARTEYGIYARETDDVFEEHNIIHGFVCKHMHQPYGACPRYEVRVLCKR